MNEKARKTPRHRIGLFCKEGGKAFVATCIVILLLEVTLRLAAFVWYNYSEYHLFYGFHRWVGRVGISPWSTFEGGYYKFPPNYILKGATGAGPETASINSHGFRGPDFQAVKPKGVFRVLCLGGSSTFGFHNGDNETYPFLLEGLFAKEGIRVQVINAGFPYYNTGSILSLLKEELLSYEPDLITLYTAYNDTSWPVRIGLLGRAVLWVQEHSIVYLLLRDNIREFMFGVEKKVFGKLIPQKTDYGRFKKDTELIASRYRENLRSIARVAKSRGIPVVLIKQPITTRNQRYASVSYEKEYQSIRERFERDERLSVMELWMIKHHRLISELEKIAQQEKLPVVDNIKIVDQDRRRLTTWVHLTGEANLRLAETLEATIKPYVLRKQASGRPAKVSSHL